MGTNRRKAVRDRKKHREKVEKWAQKRREKLAKAVADRLLGKIHVRGPDGVDYLGRPYYRHRDGAFSYSPPTT